MSSAVRTFSDPDDYAAAIRGASVELTVTGSKHFTASQIRIDFHRLWMQRLCESGPVIGHVTDVPGRAMVTFVTQPGPEVVTCGVAMPATALVRNSPAQEYDQRSSGATSHGAMSLPLEDMASLGAAISGRDLMPPRDPLIVFPPPPAMARLLRLHAAAGQLAEDAPAVIAHAEAARSLEQALIEALVACLSEGEVRGESLAQRHHAVIMRRFHRALEENPDRAFYLPELCTAIGVADRTLRACCHEHLGTGPKRYLLLRRMHMARRALRETAPAATTVTEIAAQYGFWHFGRFAGKYESLFGESPSATLRHLPE